MLLRQSHCGNSQRVTREITRRISRLIAPFFLIKHRLRTELNALTCDSRLERANCFENWKRLIEQIVVFFYWKLKVRTVFKFARKNRVDNWLNYWDPNMKSWESLIRIQNFISKHTHSRHFSKIIEIWIFPWGDLESAIFRKFYAIFVFLSNFQSRLILQLFTSMRTTNLESTILRKKRMSH